jgi:hypothetical protein
MVPSGAKGDPGLTIARMRYSVDGMSEYANVWTRAGRALSAACILLGGTVPLGIALLAGIGAGLSDNPDVTGPSDGAFVVAFGVVLVCTALAARVALEPPLRSDLGWWWFGASVLALVPIYPAVIVTSPPSRTGAQASHGPRRQRCPTSRNPCYARHEIDTNPQECPCYPLRPEWEKRSS